MRLYRIPYTIWYIYVRLNGDERARLI